MTKFIVMKKSMKIIAGFGAILLMVAGYGYGQENVKTVEGNKIVPQKAAKTVKAAKGEKAVNVTGYATATGDATSAEPVLVEGFALPERDQILLERNRKLDFLNASKKSEVKISMTDEYNWLSLKIDSNFKSGVVFVEIIDPEGEKIGTYTVKTDEPVILGENTTTSEQVSAQFGKDFRFPKKGEWIIRALPDAATGWISIDIKQAYYRGLNR